jgi:hypothetical protein
LVQNTFFSSSSSLGATFRHLFEKTNEFAPVHPVGVHLLIVRPPFNGALCDMETPFLKTLKFHVNSQGILGGSPGKFNRGRKVGDDLGFSTHDDFLFGGLRFENGIDCDCPAGTKCDV